MLISLMEEKSEGNETKFRRVAGSSALLCSLATASSTNLQNHVAIIEGWTVYILSVSYIVEKNNWKLSSYKNEIGMVEEIITATLKNIV